MPFTYLTRQHLENSPSVKDGLTPQQEGKRRRQLIRFIKTSAQALKLPGWVAETAAQICLRFYTRRSFAKNDPFTIGAASLFLACKIESSPRALQDVVVFCWQQKNANNAHELQRLHQDKTLVDGLCRDVSSGEMAILLALGFDLNYQHPQMFIFNHLKQLNLLGHPSNLMQRATNFCNDSLDTTIPVEYPAEQIALGALFAALRLLDMKLELPKGASFALHFRIDQARVEEIADRMMEMYEYNGPQQSQQQSQTSQQQLPQQAAALPADSAATCTQAPAASALEPSGPKQQQQQQEEEEEQQQQEQQPAAAAAAVSSAVPAATPQQVVFINMQVAREDATTETYRVRVERGAPGDKVLDPNIVAAGVVTVMNQSAAGAAALAAPAPGESAADTHTHVELKVGQGQDLLETQQQEAVPAPISPVAAAESQRSSKKRQLGQDPDEVISPSTSSPPAAGAATLTQQAARSPARPRKRHQSGTPVSPARP